MGQVVPFSRFALPLDPETLRVAGAAYDLAIANLGDGVSEKECEDIASRIIFAALKGQRDVKALYAAAIGGAAA